MNYWERLSHLKMNSLQRRNERYRIIYTWKILEWLVPKCGVEEISESENKRLGRLCKFPKLAGSTNTKKLRSQSLQLIGPSLFNSLPKKLTNIKQLGVDKFKEHLDEYLSEVPDEPKVPGAWPVTRCQVTPWYTEFQRCPGRQSGGDPGPNPTWRGATIVVRTKS